MIEYSTKLKKILTITGLINKKKNMKLSTQAHNLLKHILTVTGAKQTNEKGDEVDVPRCLSGEDSSQRRFYTQKLKVELDAVQAEIQPVVDEHNAKVNALKEETKKEMPEATEKEIDAKLNTNPDLIVSFKNLQEKAQEAQKRVIDLDLTPKTMKTLKKVFNEYSGEIGFMPGDDESVSEIEEALK